MKKILVLSGIIFLLIPSLAMAAYFMAEESVPSGEVIIGNLYLTGGNPSMAGDLHGDLYAAGGNVSVPGNVTNDVVITGGTVSITGVVGDDVRVFGGDITIDGKVNGEVLAFGGNVKLGPNASVRKDLIAGGGNVTIDDKAQVFGSTKLYTDKEGKFKEAFDKTSKEAFQYGYFVAILMTILIYFVVAAVIMGLFPNVITKYLTVATKKENFWKSLGMGLLIFIVTPIVAILCFVTGVGVMLGFIILLMYVMYILVNIALAGLLFGSLMQKWIMKLKKVEMNWLWGLGGIAVLHLLVQLPFVGWLVGAVFFLYSFGAVLTMDWKTYRSVK